MSKLMFGLVVAACWIDFYYTIKHWGTKNGQR